MLVFAIEVRFIDSPTLVTHFSVRRISGKVKCLNTWPECQATVVVRIVLLFDVDFLCRLQLKYAFIYLLSSRN